MKKFLKIFLKFFIFCFLLIVTMIQGLIYFSNTDDSEKNEKYVLVLGAKANKGNLSETLKERLKSAAIYLKKHKDSIAILCGGVEKGDNFSQSYYMKKYLLKENIENNRLILEEKSKNTFENIKFALFKMEKRPSELMVISSSYHLFRANLILYRFGILGYGYGAKTPKDTIFYSYIRETFAIMKTYLFDKPTSEEFRELMAK